jgi:[acyl-carrier-protein] S-malonyltransferase
MEEIEDAISFKLSKLVDEGPTEELTKTEHAQPAIFAVGMMCISIMSKEFCLDVSKECKYFAGHSLGEYTALCAAGVFSVADCARLVKMRSEIMAKAIPNRGDFLMSALIGAKAKDIEPLVRRNVVGHETCVIACDNSPVQVVISGHKSAVQRVAEEARRVAGIVKVIDLDTSGPFHSPIMSGAAIDFDRILAKYCRSEPNRVEGAASITLNDFSVPVIMNTDAAPLKNKSQVCTCLMNQITGRVRWRETIELMLNDPDIDEIVEIAPGKVLSTMIKKSYPRAMVSNIETIAQIEKFAVGDRAA